ncbi:kinase-like protein [Punctularia strigosozonata HHB-11173 SS5]|uniref:kinase-like protein n=1 Tax=Punctularia strigosozonata (strain HHB-11173) TaxID=741275 RepID=UPI00044170D4|nr:kinase-like protein [Punctularia strigosozonata HHB-11173 SS5]EIN10429.1 kinase-like protein [Punctularia strigosozonata HHB-11173 SS5]
MPSLPTPGPSVWLGQIRLEHILGHGSFGRVYYGYDASQGQAYAVKCIPKRRGQSPEELDIHRSLPSHPHILNCIAADEDDHYLYLILDYHAGGDLLEAIRKGIFYRNDQLIKKLFLQLLDAVDHIHQQKVFHCDIKPGNVICASNHANAYLADFGLATRSSRSPRARRGTLRYMSPECHQHQPASQSAEDPMPEWHWAHQSDIWSLGVTLLEMVTGKYLWTEAIPSDPRYAAYMADPDYLRQELHVSAQACELFRKIFTQDYETRITLSDLREAIISVNTFFEDVLSAHGLCVRDLPKGTSPRRVPGRDFCKSIVKLVPKAQRLVRRPPPRRSRHELSISSDEGYHHDIPDEHEQPPRPRETHPRSAEPRFPDSARGPMAHAHFVLPPHQCTRRFPVRCQPPAASITPLPAKGRHGPLAIVTALSTTLSDLDLPSTPASPAQWASGLECPALSRDTDSDTDSEAAITPETRPTHCDDEVCELVLDDPLAGNAVRKPSPYATQDKVVTTAGPSGIVRTVGRLRALVHT